MQKFTGFEYLMIDLANQFGLDKELFNTRIQWAKDNLDNLEQLQDQADNKPLFIKAMMAIRKAQQKIPTGHLVGFDGVCSGIQIMSTITGCIKGAEATGLVDPNKRADAYSAVTQSMNDILGGQGLTTTRGKAKQALMTSFYGSRAEPIKVFGEETPELNAFYQAAQATAPGAWELLQDLLASWQAGALSHEWRLPDGYEAKVKVMVAKEARIEVDELDHASFTYQYYVNEGQEKGLSNVANVVHSIDAYVLRCIHRRCNYDMSTVEAAVYWLTEALDNPVHIQKQDPAIAYYTNLYQASGIADVVIIDHLTATNVHHLSAQHIQDLLRILDGMLEYKPFEVVTIHDEFKCHPNNMNHLRQQYVNVLCDLADGKVLDLILSDLYGQPVQYKKLSEDLSHYIAQSNYALT